MSDVSNKIPERLKGFINICADQSSLSQPEISDALIEALSIIDQKLCLSQKCNIFISESPFTIPLESGTIIYQLKPDGIGSTFENLIFLDVGKLSGCKYEGKVVCILEEFVHCLMQVRDEILTSQIVSLLYPKVSSSPDGTYIYNDL